MRNPAETSASVRCPRRWRPAAGTIDCTRAQHFFFLLLFYSYIRLCARSYRTIYYIYLYTWHYGINQRRVRETIPTHAKPDPAILLATDDLLKSPSNRRNRRGQRRRPPPPLFVGRKTPYKIMCIHVTLNCSLNVHLVYDGP